MATVVPHYPWDVLRPGKLQPGWELGGTVIGSGPTAAGIMPVTRTDGGGFWKVGFGQVSTHLPARRRSWTALTRIAKGGVQPIVVPCRQIMDQPYPLVGGVPLTSLPDVPHSDDAAFSDDSEYSSSTMSVQLVSAAALRDTTLTVDLIVGNDFQGGEFFSIDHETLRYRLYNISTVAQNDDATWSITIDPPLRAAVPADTFLEFDYPKCVMRIASMGEMDAGFEPYWFGEQNVSFIEAFPPFPE